MGRIDKIFRFGKVVERVESKINTEPVDVIDKLREELENAYRTAGRKAFALDAALKELEAVTTVLETSKEQHRRLAESHAHYVESAERDVKRIVQLESELEAVKGERDELNQLFDVIHAADIRGIKMWQAESHVERELIHPDKAKMVCWLLEQNDKLREENDHLLLGAAADLSLIGEVNENAKNLRGMAKEILTYMGFSCDPFPTRTEVMNRCTQLQKVEQEIQRLAEENARLKSMAADLLAVVCGDGGFSPCADCQHETCVKIREAKAVVEGGSHDG